MIWLDRARILAAVGLVLWAGYRAHIPAITTDRRLMTLPPSEGDPIEHLDRQFQSLIPWLPDHGTVGYLPPPGGEAYGGFFVAEYALAPRIVVPGANAEFVIVPAELVPGADRASNAPLNEDSRLPGFLLYREVETGARVYRRVR